jgi:hypothetical protein
MIWIEEMACRVFNSRKWQFQGGGGHRARIALLSEIARIDETIAEIEEFDPEPDEPIMLAHVQVSTRAEAVALLRRCRREIERRMAA